MAVEIEAACELANRDAIDLLAAEHGFDETEAYTFSSLTGVARTRRLLAARRT